jgi:hypothetical protein
VNRLTVPAVYIGAFLMMASCPGARASVDFSGRLAVSADHAGQSFLQVILSPDSGVQSLQRVEDSETTYNAMLDTEWEFDLAGPHSLLLENRLRHGTALTRDRLRLGYRYRDDNGQRFDLDSETDIENGKVFDRDETDVRQSIFARWVRPIGGSRDRLEIYGGAEVRRVEADTLFFLQSHNLGKAKITWFRDFGLLNSFDLGYAVRGVAAVDSAPGSYVEHEVTGNMDVYAGSNYYVSSEAMLFRRDYINADSSSASGWGFLGRGTVRHSPSLAIDIEAKPSLEFARYDLPDFIYFDYQKAGMDAGLKVRPIDQVGLKVFPGGEILRAPGVEREDYNQYHVTFGGDVMAPGVWLDISYKVGRRNYASPAPRDDLESVPRSDYTFGDLLLLADKRIKGPLSLRMTASHSVEWHELREDDVTIFLLSTEITYRF